LYNTAVYVCWVVLGAVAKNKTSRKTMSKDIKGIFTAFTPKRHNRSYLKRFTRV